MKQMHKSSIKVMRMGAFIQVMIFAFIIAIFYCVTWYFALPISKVVFIILAALLLLDILWYMVLKPILIYDSNYYDVGDDEIVLLTGIWNKEELIVPYVKIQNVETEQGPVMKRYHLKSLTVHTAENGLSIQLIHEDEASVLKASINQKMREVENDDNGDRHRYIRNQQSESVY